MCVKIFHRRHRSRKFFALATNPSSIIISCNDSSIVLISQAVDLYLIVWSSSPSFSISIASLYASHLRFACGANHLRFAWDVSRLRLTTSDRTITTFGINNDSYDILRFFFLPYRFLHFLFRVRVRRHSLTIDKSQIGTGYRLSDKYITT
jgi:hypothetical protein